MAFDELHQRYVSRMRSAGIPEATAREIVVALGEVAEQRSALRLQAAEGGWLDTDEYVEALQAIADGHRLIRSRYGDDVFERYLYATLEPNRVMVSSTQHDGSDATDELQSGDVIHQLGNIRCFSIREYRQHVDDAGDDSGLVSLIVQRGSRLVTLRVCRRQLRQLAVEPAYARP